MILAQLNELAREQVSAELRRCCGAEHWVDQMLARRPFVDRAALHSAAAEAARSLEEKDWLEAFSHHPKIGDLDALRGQFASTAGWAASEQAGATSASDEVLRALAESNRVYEERFGFRFIVCATGRNAAEMLALLQARLDHPRSDELRIAAGEQEKITLLRLEKLLSP